MQKYLYKPNTQEMEEANRENNDQEQDNFVVQLVLHFDDDAMQTPTTFTSLQLLK